MTPKIITPVTSPVIPLAEIRQHLRLDLLGDSTHPDDSLIEGYLLAAREYAEHYTQRSIGAQTLELALDKFPDAGIELPLGAASITSIKYTDTSLVLQTIESTDYVLDDCSFTHWAIPVSVWPTPAEVANAVKVRYVTPATFSPAVKTALLLTVAHLYENREAVGTDRMAEVPLSVDALLNTARTWQL